MDMAVVLTVSRIGSLDIFVSNEGVPRVGRPGAAKSFLLRSVGQGANTIQENIDCDFREFARGNSSLRLIPL
jgi:hypothetical protein